MSLAPPGVRSAAPGAIDISPHLVFFAALTALSPRTPLRAMAFGRTKTTTKTTPVAKGGTAG